MDTGVCRAIRLRLDMQQWYHDLPIGSQTQSTYEAYIWMRGERVIAHFSKLVAKGLLIVTGIPLDCIDMEEWYAQDNHILHSHLTHIHSYVGLLLVEPDSIARVRRIYVTSHSTPCTDVKEQGQFVCPSNVARFPVSRSELPWRIRVTRSHCISRRIGRHIRLTKRNLVRTGVLRASATLYSTETGRRLKLRYRAADRKPEPGI